MSIFSFFSIVGDSSIFEFWKKDYQTKIYYQLTTILKTIKRRTENKCINIHPSLFRRPCVRGCLFPINAVVLALNPHLTFTTSKLVLDNKYLLNWWMIDGGNHDIRTECNIFITHRRATVRSVEMCTHAVACTYVYGNLLVFSGMYVYWCPLLEFQRHYFGIDDLLAC